MKKEDRGFVGIVTCFLDNCGACLQAYALQKTISLLGYNNEIIRYTEPDGYYKATYKNSNKLYQIFHCITNKKFRRKYRRGLYRQPAFNGFRKKYLVFSQVEYKNVQQLIPNPQKYNIYVCGSDQIWNPTFYNKCNPVYYLSFVEKSHLRIAYAPSIGLNDIPDNYLQEFREYITLLDYISVREQKGVELIKRYTERESKLVLDPTLLLAKEEWCKILKNKRKQKRNPYLFCYLFGNRDYYSKIIKKIADDNNLEIRIIPIFINDVKPDYIKELNAGPIEFISLIQNAELVLTDSFHASVFSLLFKKNFYVLLRDSDNNVKSMNSRLYNLMNLVGLRDRLLTQSEAEKLIISPIENYEVIYNTIEKMREESLSFLKDALEGK